MSIFQYDHTLPALPAATLADTCENLKSMIKPLVNTEVWKEACHLLDQFSAESGDGTALQKLLTDWKDSMAGNNSWLRPIWNDIYLSYRDRLPVNMNYSFRLMHERWGEDALPVFISGLCHMAKEIRSDSLEAEASRAGYQSMDMLESMIYTRIPGTVQGTLYYPPLSAPATVAVVCKGHWFILSLQDKEGGIVSPASIKTALSDIRKKAETMGDSESIGTMTCAKQDDALKMRALVSENIGNRINLASIENALFTVSLDEVPEKEEDFAYHLICGECANRWYDKSLQIISAGEYLGVNIEHSGCDAGIWTYFLSQTDRFISEQSGNLGSNDDQAHIRPLEWVVSDELTAQLQKADTDYNALVESLSISQVRIDSVSKNIIKSKKCSPDAFVQLLYQASYYKLTGKFRSVYEAVSSRNFYQGRTECVRPCTLESVAFIKALTEKEEPSKTQELFRLAENAHRREIGKCQQASGAERHMAGLLAICGMYADTSKYAGENPPAIYKSEGYQTLRHDAVSTSSVTAPYIDFFGFGPVVDDGMGIGYGVKDGALHLMISSYKESGICPDQFILVLKETADEFLKLL